MRGDPLHDVTVQLQIGSDSKLLGSAKTNLQGYFEIIPKLDGVELPSRATVVAVKTGFREGRETLDLVPEQKGHNLSLALRQLDEDPGQLSVTMLVEFLGPQLRENGELQLAGELDRKAFRRGCEELIERNNAIAAIPLIRKSVELVPECIDCRLLLTLASLQAGSWGSAHPQLERLAELTGALDAAQRSKLDLVMGVLKALRGDDNEATRCYLRVLESDSNNMLALQELGRIFFAHRKWEAADSHLERALQAGAGDFARVLRIRTLLELGDVSEARREMDQYTEGRSIKGLPQSERALFDEVQNRVKLLSYTQIRSIIEQPMTDLVALIPELEGIDTAAEQGRLEEILQHTGVAVDRFFNNFPNTVSTEQVHQERLTKDRKLQASLDQTFIYLMVANAGKPGLGVQEHRSTVDGGDASLDGSNKGLMLTSGFASASSIFHSVNQGGTDFRYLGMQTLNGSRTHVVAFAQKPEKAKMVTRFVTDRGSALILVQGVAWIDAESFHVLRLCTFLLNPLPSVRLQSQTTEIDFQKTEFNGGTVTLWLPREVTVEVNWRGRLFRNRHRYSDFRLFSIDVKEEKKAPSAKISAN